MNTESFEKNPLWKRVKFENAISEYAEDNKLSKDAKQSLIKEQQTNVQKC